MNKISGFFGQYRFLSNFYPSLIEFEGQAYPSAEHMYQALKFDKVGARRMIAKALTAKRAKHLAKSLRGIQRVLTPEELIANMRVTLALKFGIPHMREYLMSTGDSYLEETNTWGDTFWGVCGEVGENHLGKLLMDVRQDIVDKPGKPV